VDATVTMSRTHPRTGHNFPSAAYNLERCASRLPLSSLSRSQVRSVQFNDKESIR
jgi:hypothetical protein